jgi:hypothetical protein
MSGPVDPMVAKLARVLVEAQDCFTGANLLSTANEADLRETARRFLAWWNDRAAPALQALDDPPWPEPPDPT